MLELIKRVGRVFAIAFLVVVGSAEAVTANNDLADAITNRVSWQDMDWRNPEISHVGKLLSSLAASDSTVTVLGDHFKVTWTSRQDNVPVIHLEGENRLGDCKGFGAKMASKFGKAIFDDGTLVVPLSETDSMHMVFEFFQWDIGKTRVVSTCIGPQTFPPLSDGNRNLTWSIAFSSLSGLSEIKPKFALRCTRTIAYTDGTTTESTDLAFWVDPNVSAAENPDQTSLSDAGTFHATDARLDFSVTRGDVKSDYVIDRFTGSLSAQVSAKNLSATIHGNCEKSSSLAPKF